MNNVQKLSTCIIFTEFQYNMCLGASDTNVAQGLAKPPDGTAYISLVFIIYSLSR